MEVAAARPWTGTGRRRAVWVVPAMALPATVLGLLLLATSSQLPAASEEAWILTILPLWSLLGAALLTRAPRHLLGQLMLLVGTASATAVFSKGWAVHAAIGQPGALPGGTAAAWVSGWAWVLTAVPLVGLLPLLLPDGRLPAPAFRTVVAAVVTSIVLLVTSNALAPGDLPEWPGVPNPVGLPSALAAPLAAGGAAGALLVPACALAATAGLVTRWRRSSGGERERLRLVALSATPLAAAVTWSSVAPSAAATTAAVVAVAAWSVCLASAAVQHRLFEVDVAMSRTAVWVTVCGGLLALHVGTVSVLDGVAGASLLATALVAVLFAPARDLLQRRVNAFLFGHRDDPWSALAAVGQRVEAAGHPHEALEQVVEVLAASMRLASVQVLLDDGQQELPAASHGTPPELAGSRCFEQPLVHLGERVGALRVAPRAGEALGRRDRALLAELAKAVAVNAAVVVGTERLRRSQQELVSVAEEERKRLRRDLHDELGPTLTGVAFALEAARNLTTIRPGDVAPLLDGATQELHSALADLRRLVEGLRPPALDDLGLNAALEQRARALAVGSGICIRLEVSADLPALAAAVEVAVYRIVVEGLTNAARHAGARHCVARLTEADAVLTIEVRDDGRGVPSPLRLATGLLSVRERAEALGGSAELRPGPRGAVLHAVIPL